MMRMVGLLGLPVLLALVFGSPYPYCEVTAIDRRLIL